MYVVADLVLRHLRGGPARAGLQRHHLQPRAGEDVGRDAAGTAETHDEDIGHGAGAISVIR